MVFLSLLTHKNVTLHNVCVSPQSKLFCCQKRTFNKWNPRLFNDFIDKDPDKNKFVILSPPTSYKSECIIWVITTGCSHPKQKSHQMEMIDKDRKETSFCFYETRRLSDSIINWKHYHPSSETHLMKSKSSPSLLKPRDSIKDQLVFFCRFLLAPAEFKDLC